MKKPWIAVLLLLAACQSPSTTAPESGRLASPSTSERPTPVDCEAVRRIDPASAEANDIANAFVAGFLIEWPTEYMAFDQLWAVDQYHDVVIIQGLVTEEESDVIVAALTPEGLRMRARVTSHAGVRTREELIAEISRQDASIPSVLLQCANFNAFLTSVARWRRGVHFLVGECEHAQQLARALEEHQDLRPARRAASFLMVPCLGIVLV